MEMMNYCTQIRDGLQSTDYTDFIHRLHGFSGAGTFSLWSAHVETRRATSQRGKHNAAITVETHAVRLHNDKRSCRKSDKE